MWAYFPRVLYAVLLAGALALPWGSGPVRAEGVVSEAFYRRLTGVHDLIGENKLREAQDRLDQIRVSNSRRYEKALLLQTYGYLYAETERYSEAVEALSACLELNALSRPATKRTLYVVAQLQVSNQEYAAALENLEQWFALEASPGAEAHALAGWVNARLERYQPAIEHLRQAISIEEQPKELWYQQLLALYYDSQRLGDAAELLQRMVVLFPDEKKYWLNLSGVYQTLEQDAQSLAVLELAYKRGLLDDEPDLIRLARYYIYVEAPIKAADLLRVELAKGTLAASSENWLLLSEAWLGAKEMNRAMGALERALQERASADLSLRLAQIASQVQDWDRVIRALENRGTPGGESDHGASDLLLGIAHYNLDHYAEALAAFERAEADTSVRDRAEQWRLLTMSELGPNGLAEGQ